MEAHGQQASVVGKCNVTKASHFVRRNHGKGSDLEVLIIQVNLKDLVNSRIKRKEFNSGLEMEWKKEAKFYSIVLALVTVL